MLLGLLGLVSFTLGVIDVLIVVLAFEVLGTGDAGVRVLNVALGIGSIVGATLAVVVVTLARTPILGIPMGQGGTGAGLVLGGVILLGLLLDVGRLRSS